jgi:hypothetical protein
MMNGSQAGCPANPSGIEFTSPAGALIWIAGWTVAHPEMSAIKARPGGYVPKPANGPPLQMCFESDSSFFT